MTHMLGILSLQLEREDTLTDIGAYLRYLNMTIHIPGLVRKIEHLLLLLIDILKIQLTIQNSLETHPRKRSILLKKISNIDCKEFDKFSENLGYESATTIIAKSFPYTSISPCYNINKKDFMGFIRDIEKIF